VLGAFAAMAIIAAVVFFSLAGQPLEQRILVDEETRSVVFTTQYRSGPTTERLKFEDIGKLEHISNIGYQEVVAITLDGERKIIMTAEKTSLMRDAERYAAMMDKPLDKIDNTGLQTGRE
jgi:hypothetical protein